MNRALVILILGLCGVLAARAAVDLTLYDSYPIVDSNGTTPLEGTSAAGDLVQLILAGPNGVIDPPTTTGTPGGDDSVLFTTHVGAGLTTTNTGLLVQSSILYPDIFGGNSNAFVRFWNSNSVVDASYYGNSALFTLPSGDAFGLAELDFAPSSGSSRTANESFSFGGAEAIPEPSNLFLLGLLALGGRWFWRRRRTGQ